MEEKKRKRRRKRSKSQEEKRSMLISGLLDRWVCVKQSYEDEDRFYFVKHRLKDGSSHSKIEQIILSGDPIQDGVYDITDYDIDKKFDTNSLKEILEIRPKKFDLKIGLYTDKEIVKNFDELKKYLVDAKYLTEDDLRLYCQSNNRPPGVEEILMDFDTYTGEE